MALREQHGYATRAVVLSEDPRVAAARILERTSPAYAKDLAAILSGATP